MPMILPICSVLLWVVRDADERWAQDPVTQPVSALKLTDPTYGSEWQDLPDGAKIGYTVQQRIPQRWRVKEGQALQQQPILNQTVPISLTKQLQVAMGWSSADDAILIEEVQERYDKPAGQAFAARCDAFFQESLVKSIYFNIGTPGQRITSNDVWTDGVAKLHAFGVPDELNAVIEPRQQSALQSSNLTLFNPTSTISNVFRKGFFGFGAFGVNDWAWDSHMVAFTTGSFVASTPVTSSAGQSGSTLAISGMGVFDLKEGDRFTIAGVYGVESVSYVNTNILQDFVLMADVAGSSTATLSISPSIIADPDSPLQTVNALPANGAALSFKGATGTVGATMTATTTKLNLIANAAAFAFVSADLPVKLAGAVAGRTPGAKTDKISIRYVDQYNIQTDQLPRRMDGLVGAAPVLPYFALIAYS
jgi:hypothetical protein